MRQALLVLTLILGTSWWSHPCLSETFLGPHEPLTCPNCRDMAYGLLRDVREAHQNAFPGKQRNDSCDRETPPASRKIGWGTPRAGGPSAQRQPFFGGWSSSPDRDTCETPPPAVARIWVRGKGAVKRTGGTAVLIYKRGKEAVAITAQHLFRNLRKPVEVILEFPSGKNFQGTLVAEDSVSDLAAVTLDAPDAEPIQIYLDDPKIGERVTVAGYGMDGCYKTTAGIVKGPKRTSSGVACWLEMTGGSRGGDSGGPMLNSSGQLLGILWGTSGTTSTGAFNGRICQFLETQRYALPWNADIALEKERNRQQPRKFPLIDVPMPPPDSIQSPQVLPGPTIDSMAREMARNALEQSAEALVAVGDLSKDVAQAHDATVEATVERVKEATAGIEKSVIGKAMDASKAMAFGLLKSWGLGGGLLATGIVGIGFLFFRSKLTGLAQLIDSLTDKTPWKWDDRLIDPMVYRAASLASGKPIPEYANKPGMDPYGKPYPTPQQPAPPPTQPAPVTTDWVDSPTIAELVAKVAALEVKTKGDA